MEIIEKLEAHKRETFDDARRLKRDHDEGAIIYGNPVGAFVVRDQFISTTCSGCLKTYGCKTQSQTQLSQLQRCSKCKFVRYCSVDCGVSTVTDCRKSSVPSFWVSLLTGQGLEKMTQRRMSNVECCLEIMPESRHHFCSSFCPE